MNPKPAPDDQDAQAQGDAGTAPAPTLVFGGTRSVFPDKAIIHDNDTFAVQWSARNQGATDAPAFTDLLVITQIPEGCPGSDDQDHPVVYNSDNDGNPQDYMEGPLAKGTEGPLMQPTAGPFPAGFYRLTVTIAAGLADVTTFNCVEIIQQ
jgi:hypothetical protein